MTKGGYREGSGRKGLYGELEVKRIKISIPALHETEIRRNIEELLKKYKPKK
jgi:hypothetical protein